MGVMSSLAGATGDYLKKEGKDIAGIVEKAYITIHDKRGKGSGLSALPGTEGSVLATVKKIGNTQIIPAEASPLGADKMYQLQFNPASIRIFSHADARMMKTLQETVGAEGVNQSVQQASTMFEVDLLFDAVDISDVFMQGRTISNLIPGAVSTVKSIVAGAKNTVAFSVKDQIMAFVGAAMDSRTRMATFSWSNFSFRGMINEMRATYTMFNPRGEPIRGHLTLRLRKMNDSATEIKQSSKDFDDVFGNSYSDGNVSAAGMFTAVKNLTTFN